jgi:bilin biosynthesis protein
VSNLSDASAAQRSADQLRVDQLIAEITEQIELLDFDSPEPALLRELVLSLADSRQAARLGLIEIFSQIGEPATPFLLEGLASHIATPVRRACCNALTNIGDPASVAGLVEALVNDPDIGVKSAAAAALAKVGVPAFGPLRQVLTSATTDESCKGHAAWAIASISHEANGEANDEAGEVRERLYGLMKDASAAVRTAAVGAIAQLAQKSVQTQADQTQADQTQADQTQADQTQKALTTLTQALSDPSSEVRIEAAANLARLNYQPAYSPLIRCLQDPHAEVRSAAVMALAKLGNPDAIGAIAPLQQDSEPSVQRVAKLVMQQLLALKPPA